MAGVGRGLSRSGWGCWRKVNVSGKALAAGKIEVNECGANTGGYRLTAHD